MALSKFLRSFHATFVAVHVVTVKSKGSSASKLVGIVKSMTDITTVVSSQEKS